MSITDTFDRNGEGIIKARNNVRMIENFPTTLLVVFSAKICKLFLSKYDATQIGALFASNGRNDILKYGYFSRVEVRIL